MKLTQRNSLLLALAGCLVCVPAWAQWQTGQRDIMGTSIDVQLWHPDEGLGGAAIEAVMEEMHRIDRLMSTYKEQSEISRVNRDAHAAPVPASRELATLVGRTLRFSEITSGAFDITYASVGFLYDYREKIRPDEAARTAALTAVNYRFVAVDPSVPSIRFLRPGVRIDLGGVAKGYAVEQGARVLRERGIEHAIVTAGGDSRIVGDRRGRPWTVGIRDPRARGQVATRIPLVDEAISTSGDYERFFESDGVRYHHILRPGTGLSPDEIRSATVIGPDATQTDALSTGVFVLGLAEGIALIERLDGYETVVIDRDARMHFSTGLAPAR